MTLAPVLAAPITDSRPLLVIIGPSASGKSSVVRELHRRRVIRVHPTWTTRPRRSDEGQGSVEHRFVSDGAFDRLCTRGFFVDTVQLFGLPYRYGLPAIAVAPAGPLDAVMLRAPLVPRIVELVPACLVYQIVDTAERTRRRLVARGSPALDAAARLNDNQQETAAGRVVAHRMFVNDGPLAVLVDQVAACLTLDVVATARGRQ